MAQSMIDILYYRFHHLLFIYLILPSGSIRNYENENEKKEKKNQYKNIFLFQKGSQYSQFTSFKQQQQNYLDSFDIQVQYITRQVLTFPFFFSTAAATATTFSLYFFFTLSILLACLIESTTASLNYWLYDNFIGDR